MTFDTGCRVEGSYDAVIKKGRLSGVIVRGGTELVLSATIDDDGKLREGRAGFRKFTGKIEGTSGRGMLQHRNNCLAAWELTLVEAAQAASADRKITVAVAADDAAPVIEAPGTVQTDGPVIELTGRVSDRSAIIEFTVNGAATALQADGGFYIKRGVAQGQSELVIAALDEWGNRAERRVTVTRSAASATRSADAAGDTAAPMIALLPAIETDTAMVEISGGIVDASAIIDVARLPGARYHSMRMALLASAAAYLWARARWW